MDAVDQWALKVCASETTRHYKDVIYCFGSYAQKNHKLNFLNLKEEYRQTKYSSGQDKERFLDRVRDVTEDYICLMKTKS